MLGPLLPFSGGLPPNGIFFAHSVVESVDVFGCSAEGKAARAFSSGEEMVFGRSGGGEVAALICDSNDGEEALWLSSISMYGIFTI